MNSPLDNIFGDDSLPSDNSVDSIGSQTGGLDIDKMAAEASRNPPNADVVMRNDVARTLAFDLERYEKICEICSEENVIQLNNSPEHLLLLKDLYSELELSADAFHAISQGDYSELARCLRNGCYVDRHTPSREERIVLDSLNIDTIMHKYVSSGEELEQLLSGKHPRCEYDDFYAWGHMDPSTEKLAAMTAVFLPPKEPERMEDHKRHIADLFRPESGSNRTFQKELKADIKQIFERSDTTAEFFMIGVSREMEGAGVPVYEHMMNQPVVNQAIKNGEVTDFYLSRFASLDQVHPSSHTKEKRVAPDDENEASRALFRKLGYSTFGKSCDERQLAAREIQGGEVVVVNSVWSIAHADAKDSMDIVTSLMSGRHQMAKEARDRTHQNTPPSTDNNK